MLLYSGTNVDNKETTSYVSAWSMFLGFMGPLLISITNICLRYMRCLNEYTSPAYTVIFSVTILSFLIPVTDSQITITSEFNLIDYLILIFVSVAGGVGMIFKTKAMQYEMAGRLGMLWYLSIICSFMFDMLLIGNIFNMGAFKGILIILAANLISGYMVFKKGNCLEPKQ